MPYPSLRQDPTTPAEWHVAALSAAGLLLIEDAKLYGFVTGGPDIDRDRCEEILALAGEHGITIGIDQATQAGLDLIASFNSEAPDA